MFNFTYILNELILHPVGAAVLAVLATVVYYAIKNRGLPPGPTGMPYFGYWPFLDETSTQVEELAKKYGSVFSFTVLGRLFIHLGSNKALREVHITKSDCFEKRPSEFSMLNMIFNDGIPGSSGEQWKVLRRFFVQCLKEYGFASIKVTMAAPMYDTINEMMDELRVSRGKPVAINEMMAEKCTLICRRLLFNDYELSPEKARELNDAYLAVVGSATPSNLLLFGPFAEYVIFPFTPRYRKAVENNKIVKKILLSLIKKHESTFNEHSIRDVIDSYLKERNSRRRIGDPTAMYFTDDALVATLAQFIGDGIITTAALIAFALQILMEHPEEQQKIYEELTDVLGPERQPTAEDKGKLHYTNAFVYEVLRTLNFFPYVPGLECTKETTFNGYRIPKGSITLMSVWLVHNDSEVYEEPHLFNPSRFIAKPGKPKPELPMTFGLGKRACIGEVFVTMQMFLFLSTLVKNFNLSLPAGISADKVLDMIKLGTWEICAHPRT